MRQVTDSALRPSSLRYPLRPFQAKQVQWQVSERSRHPSVLAGRPYGSALGQQTVRGPNIRPHPDLK